VALGPDQQSVGNGHREGDDSLAYTVLGKDLELSFSPCHEHNAVLPDGVKHTAGDHWRGVIIGTGLRESLPPNGLARCRIKALDFASIPQQVSVACGMEVLALMFAKQAWPRRFAKITVFRTVTFCVIGILLGY
jgi:hypothetical protein